MPDTRERRLQRQSQGVCGSIKQHLKSLTNAGGALPSGANVLEVGVGEGRNLPAFKGMSVHLFGIDISELAIELAADLLEREGMQAELFVGSFTELPYPDGSMDMVFSHHAVQNARTMDDLEDVFCEIARVLKPGGHYFMSEAAAPKVDEPGRTRRVAFLNRDEVTELAAIAELALPEIVEPRDCREDTTRLGGRRLEWELSFVKP